MATTFACTTCRDTRQVIEDTDLGLIHTGRPCPDCAQPEAEHAWSRVTFATPDSRDRAWDTYSSGVAPQFAADPITLGPVTSWGMMHDPKHLAFVLARYKFVAKMLEGKADVLEIGCGDAFGTPTVAQTVGKLHAVDWDERYIEPTRRRLAGIANLSLRHFDITKMPVCPRVGTLFDAIYWLDVLEHLDPAREDRAWMNIVRSLKPNGILITGTPNKAAAQYASEPSRAQHINLKTHDELRALTGRYFENVFMFGMNDEVVHTGFGPMCHYLISVGVGVKR